jgi:hypothetical protein
LVFTRRMFLALLAGAILSARSEIAWTKDGGDGGRDDGGHDDGGGDDSGSGGDDDGGGDDSGHDEGGDDHGGDKGKKREDDEWSQDQALRERELGRVIPLKTALRIVAEKVRGRVIDVDLLARAGRPQYRVKVRRTDGVIQTVRLDARTGRIIGVLGF